MLTLSRLCLLKIISACFANIENITWPRVDLRFLVEHEKITFISTSGHVTFFLSYKHTNKDVFDDFPIISDHFPKILHKCSEDYTKGSEPFYENCRR